MKNDKQIVQFAVQIATDCDLFRNRCGGLIQIRQTLEFRGRLSQYASHIFGVQTMFLLSEQFNDYFKISLH